MRTYFQFAVFIGLIFLYFHSALAATEITGEVTAKRGDSVQVSFKPHQQASPRKGDTVAFSLDIKGIKVKAGSGTVAAIEGDTLWVDLNPESKGKARLKAIAVIQATGQVDVSPLLRSKYQSFLKTQDHTIYQELQTYAQGGNPTAQYLMGSLVSRDLGGQKAKPAEAFQWFQKAASQGYGEAMVSLATSLASGTGTSRDLKAAMDWLRKAEARADAKMQFDIGFLYELGLVGIVEDEAKAWQLYVKAAEGGYAEAQHKLGSSYSLGQLVSQDHAAAAKWYGKAAAQGLAESQYALAHCYKDGQGIGKNGAEARKWMVKAAEQGHDGAIFDAGLYYHLGIGGPKDPNQAANWYRKAVEMGSFAAMEYLGKMAEKGEGMPQDTAEAIRWYRMAVAQSKYALEARDALKRLGAE